MRSRHYGCSRSDAAMKPNRIKPPIASSTGVGVEVMIAAIKGMSMKIRRKILRVIVGFLPLDRKLNQIVHHIDDDLIGTATQIGSTHYLF
jgi:hypothetical protein